MKESVGRKGICSLSVIAILMFVFAFVYVNNASAANPKCQCFKGADLTKLFKKEFTIDAESYNNESDKSVWMWNCTGKGTSFKCYDYYFRWYSLDADTDVCEYSKQQYKDKGKEGGSDWKSSGSGKIREMEAEGPDSTECATAIDEFFPPEEAP